VKPLDDCRVYSFSSLYENGDYLVRSTVVDTSACPPDNTGVIVAAVLVPILVGLVILGVVLVICKRRRRNCPDEACCEKLSEPTPDLKKDPINVAPDFN
jgi:hypothetical protein